MKTKKDVFTKNIAAPFFRTNVRNKECSPFALFLFCLLLYLEIIFIFHSKKYFSTQFTVVSVNAKVYPAKFRQKLAIRKSWFFKLRDFF